MTDSAGAGNWHVGDPPYPAMQDAARRRGYDLSDLRARQITTMDFDRFDLILAMDDKHLTAIEALRPAGNATPVHLFTGYAPGCGLRHVPDPYNTRDFDGTLHLIEDCARGLAATL